MLSKIKYYLQATADTFMPRQCPVCRRVMGSDEHHLCRQCLATLPLTHIEDVTFNAMEQLFAGKVPIERAAALFYYEKGSPHASILHDIKYRNMARLAVWMGTLAVLKMKHSGFFDGIDIVVPVPLHRDKLAKRGYNQAEMIAHGIAEATGATLMQAVVATRPHSTQTRKGAYERWLNTQDTVAAAPRALNALQGKHVLLVDDVITTGSTIIRCAEALSTIPGIKQSVFTLAKAHHD